MRLTLRNMLAYLDGILEPQDAQDIAKKIEESKFAADLMHRIRDLLRRLRLAAPSISERGPGLDPNTVAEYLDNTLPVERVTDFEKVCLEANAAMADIHLAEVAACHQILTLVLGEPADIEPASRNRMYQLPSQPKPPKPAPQAPGAHLPPPIPAHPQQHPFVPQDYLDYKSRTKPRVPEYLREPRKKRPWFAIASGILVAIFLLLVILNVFGQLERSSPIGNLFVRLGLISAKEKEIANSQNASKAGPSTPAKNEGVESAAHEPKSTPEKVTSGESTKASLSPLPPSQEAKISAGKESAQTTQNTHTENKSTPSDIETTPEIPGVTDTVPPPAPSGAETPAATPGKGVPGEGITSPSEKSSEQPGPNENGIAAVTPQPPIRPNEAPPTIQKPMGRFTSPDQILLRSTGDFGNWERLPGGTILLPQQQLLALPTYRPEIKLSSNLILQMLGGTEVELLPGDSQSPSGIKIRYGRVVINSVANPGMRLRLAIGDRAGTLIFLDAETKVGIEVRRLHEAGADPETEESRNLTEIFVVKDRVTWEEGSVKPLEIAAPTRITLLPQVSPTAEPAKDFPKWILAAEPIKEIDRQASQKMLPSFTPEQPAQQKLIELADPSQSRLKEVRWLAVRSLGYLDYFDPMVKALNDTGYKYEWDDYYIKWLREAVAREPRSAAAVRETLEKHYSPQADNLYRMLWGYSDKGLVAGDAAKLVKNLDDEDLAVRVLAFYNLKDITQKDLGYKPEDPLTKRVPKVKYWEQRLEAKEIRLKSAEK